MLKEALTKKLHSTQAADMFGPNSVPKQIAVAFNQAADQMVAMPPTKTLAFLKQMRHAFRTNVVVGVKELSAHFELTDTDRDMVVAALSRQLELSDPVKLHQTCDVVADQLAQFEFLRVELGKREVVVRNFEGRLAKEPAVKPALDRAKSALEQFKTDQEQDLYWMGIFEAAATIAAQRIAEKNGWKLAYEEDNAKKIDLAASWKILAAKAEPLMDYADPARLLAQKRKQIDAERAGKLDYRDPQSQAGMAGDPAAVTPMSTKPLVEEAGVKPEQVVDPRSGPKKRSWFGK
jgi:hypothetical protein